MFRLLLLCVCVAHASAFFRRCIDFENIDPNQAHDVYVSVASEDCSLPVSGVTMTQFCFGFFQKKSVPAVEIAPGIYKYTSVNKPHALRLSKSGFSSEYVSIGGGTSDVTEHVILRCRGGGRRFCTSETHQITVNNNCPQVSNSPQLFSFEALSIKDKPNDVFELELCKTPSTAFVTVGDFVETVSITSTNQQVNVDCNNCPSFKLSLVSQCDNSAICGATLSLPNREIRPGVYVVDVCNSETSVTASKFGFQTSSATLQDPLASSLTVALECTESLVMITHPQSKFRNAGKSVKMCCMAQSSPGIQSITYQWYKDGIELSGETANEISLTALGTSNSGVYHCRASITSQSLSVDSNSAQLTVSSDNLEAVLSNIQTICGQDYDVGACSNAPCSLSASQECVDNGIISASSVTQMTTGCGVTYTRILACQCQLAPNIVVTVTVEDAATGNVLQGMEVEVQGLGIDGETDADGKVVLTLPYGTTSANFDVTDDAGTYLGTTKVLEEIIGSNVAVTVKMHAKPNPIIIDPAVENVFFLSETPEQQSGTVNMKIPANAFFDASGNPVTGPVSLILKVLPPNEDIVDQAPGIFKARDENGEVTELETGGVFTMTAEDSSGNRVSSLPIQFEAQNGFWLWEWKNAVWERIPVPAKRKRRQTNTSEFIGELGIDVTGLRWYNIDKFPENTKCWFKTRFYDVSSGSIIADNAAVRYNALTLAVTDVSMLSLTRSIFKPSEECFEIRCDSAGTAGTPKGYITVESITLGNALVTKATPFELTAYTADVQTDLTPLNYAKPTAQSISIDLVASTDGPFFDNKGTCEGSNDPDEKDNVLRFTIKPPEYDDPHNGSDDRCVARLMLDSPWHQDNNDSTNSTTNSPAARRRRQTNNVYTGDFYAISRWGNNSVYVHKDEFTQNMNNGEIVMCFEYRCSQEGDLTNVTISFAENDNRELFYLKYYCNMTFIPEVISSTGSGYFFNSNGNVDEPLTQCAADTTDVYAHELDCNSFENGLA